MDLCEILVNLCIGIISGMFSSIIVSRIFLIQSLHSVQLARVQEHFERTYYLSGMFEGYLSSSNYKNLLASEVLKTMKIVATSECDKFNAMIFDDLNSDLYTIAVELNDYMQNMLTIKILDWKTVKELNDKLLKIQKNFTKYKKNNMKYLKKQMVKDKMLRILFVIIIIIIVMTIAGISIFYSHI